MIDTVKVYAKRLQWDAWLPTKGHPGDAGMDVYAIDDYILNPGERVTVRTGIALDIPEGHVGLVHPRSGLAFKYGITIVNAPGTIDSGYRGEINVCLLNTSDKEYVVFKGDRIAQIVFQRFSTADIEEVDELSDSVRAGNGFGSTGV